MQQIVSPGRGVSGIAPDEGYLVQIDPDEVLSEYFMQMTVEWIRNVLFCRFRPGVRPCVTIQIGRPQPQETIRRCSPRGTSPY